MATASLGDVRVRMLLPARLGADAGSPMRRAVDEPLRAELPAAFAPLDDVDPGAYWVLRHLHAHLRVSATEPDPGRIARRIAEGLAEAVAVAVRRGPSTEAVRFAGRAEYVAAYLSSRLDGGTAGWVFDRFTSFAALPPADALLAAARALDVPLLEAVASLSRAPAWHALVLGAADAPLQRLAEAVGQAADAAPEEPTDLHRVRAFVAETGAAVPQLVRGPGHSARVLLWRLADAVRAFGGRPDVVAAYVRAVLRRIGGADGRDGLGSSRAVDGHDRPFPPGRGPFPDAERQRGLESTSWAEAFASPGAAAFLLLPDLADLLASDVLRADEPVAATARARVLAAVLGGEVTLDDPALGVAAGVVEPPPELAWSPVHAALAERAATVRNDPLLGWAHAGDAAYVAAGGPLDADLETLAIALLRRFARHLPGFGRSAADYLLPRVLPSGGRVTLADDLVSVVLPMPPLGVLLALAGLDAFVYQVPWVGVPVAVSHAFRT